MELAGSSVIVTGAAGAMGAEIVRALAAHGARVLGCDVDSAGLARMHDGVPRHAAEKVAVLTSDVTVEDEVERVVDLAISNFGSIDALVNNAGIFRALGAVHEVEPSAWWRDVTVNLLGPFLCCRAVLPHMIERGRGVILNLSGGGFGGPVPGGSGYSCSKTALIRLSETLALELGRRRSIQGVSGIESDVIVFSMEPAFVDSVMTRTVASSPGGARWLPFVAGDLNDGRAASPAPVGEAVCRALEIVTQEAAGLVWPYHEDAEHVVAAAERLHDEGLYQLRVRFA